MSHSVLHNGPRVLVLALSAALIGAFGASVLAHDPPGQARDVVVKPQNWITGLAVTTGATFRVPRPVEHDEWTVVYSTAVLRLLTPKDRATYPGPEGWRFEARTRGTTEITFNGVVHPAPGTQPNPPKFVLKVTVR